MAEKTYVKGIRLFPKKEGQPDFVLASGVITKDELMEFFNEQKEHVSQYQGKDQIRIQVLAGREGKGPSVSLDTWKPAGQEQARDAAPSWGSGAAPSWGSGAAPAANSDLPF